jgi:large subunit ribosomal protein L2
MKQYKPTTPSRRHMTGYSFNSLTKKKPEKKLIRPLKKTGGRGIDGRITVRGKGGGHKRRYRFIDFKMSKFNVPAQVRALEYDPNRSARIALIVYKDGEKSYILAPDGIKNGDNIIFSEKAPIKAGNRMQLKNIPIGIEVHNVELQPGQGGKIAKSAGTSIQVLGNENRFSHLSMPSGEVRMVPEKCMASIGKISNLEHNSIVIGKAGRSRWLGRRPHVRGSAMNPVDHPHGGGEGRQPIGLKHPKTPWGKPALGVKTRKKHKRSNKYIIKRRRK